MATAPPENPATHKAKKPPPPKAPKRPPAAIVHEPAAQVQPQRSGITIYADSITVVKPDEIMPTNHPGVKSQGVVEGLPEGAE